MPGFKLVITGLDLMIIGLGLISIVLISIGMVRLALFELVDSVLYFLFPSVSLKLNYKKYYPKIAKNKDGEILKQFQTAKDEYYPEVAPLLERVSDFLFRFPIILLLSYFLVFPFLMKYFILALDTLRAYYPNLFGVNWSGNRLFVLKLFMAILFLPFSSANTFQISAYIIVVYPFLLLVKTCALLWKFIYSKLAPAMFFSAGFMMLFFLEVCLIYVGFLPLFHKGLLPFVAADEGLKQLIFWFPVKIKLYLDLILVPIVIFVPFVATIGSYILATADAKRTEKHNFPVLMYKSAIAYFYGPILGIFFVRLRNECRTIRNERKINEIMVFSMFLESFITVVGAGYAYYTMASASQLPLTGIFAGLFVMCVFVPMIIFSTNGFQSQFLHKAIVYWGKFLPSRPEEDQLHNAGQSVLNQAGGRPDQRAGA